MNNPKITVVTVCYNAASVIEETIQSVVNQTYKNIEYIIIDGASTDGTMSIVNKYRNQIATIVSEPDKGIYDAMNKGIRLATGDWINFMNAGDRFVDKNVVNALFNHIQYESTDIVYGLTLNENGMITANPPARITFAMFVFERTICHQSIFARLSTFDNNLFDDKNYRIIADRVWLYKCYKIGYNFSKINVPISIFDGNGISSNVEKFDEESLFFLRTISPIFYLIGRVKKAFRFSKKLFKFCH